MVAQVRQGNLCKWQVPGRKELWSFLGNNLS